MKTKLIALTTLALSLAFATAAEKIKAPNGGRIVEGAKPPVEILLTKERKFEVRFLDDTGKVVTPGTQVVTAITGERTAPVKLAFAKDGDKLVSDKAVPEGNNLPVVLQIAAKEGEKPVTDKFSLNTSPCPECKLLEYACTCEH